jgi:hypothetical protein
MLTSTVIAEEENGKERETSGELNATFLSPRRDFTMATSPSMATVYESDRFLKEQNTRFTSFAPSANLQQLEFPGQSPP